MTFSIRNLKFLLISILTTGFAHSGHTESDLVTSASTVSSSKSVSGQFNLTNDLYFKALYSFELHRENLKNIAYDAENGDIEAQHKLGQIFQNGFGVTKSDVVALMWYTISSKNGLKEADRNKVLTENYMASDQIILAHEMAELWLSKH
ncbi:MAG: sel1 repeat family protein [Alphaproteobacteria bacterium]|nr:sel1 repeat family protein [Alphaproteobacteria bacterium]HPF47755.1 SEL1-like repeat protein [Emcibacteraceae bacterium]HRW30017.1 SEL1-like repeat protein [Emcibacteraceae bacterium]